MDAVLADVDVETSDLGGKKAIPVEDEGHAASGRNATTKEKKSKEERRREKKDKKRKLDGGETNSITKDQKQTKRRKES